MFIRICVLFFVRPIKAAPQVPVNPLRFPLEPLSSPLDPLRFPSTPLGPPSWNLNSTAGAAAVCSRFQNKYFTIKCNVHKSSTNIRRFRSIAILVVKYFMFTISEHQVCTERSLLWRIFAKWEIPFQLNSYHLIHLISSCFFSIHIILTLIWDTWDSFYN